MKRTLYQVLGVAEDSSQDDIKSAWKRAAKEHHPDHNPGEEHVAAFQLAKRAYDVLSDAERRKRYDRKLVELRVPRCHACEEIVLNGQILCPLCALTAASAIYEANRVPPKREPTETDKLEQKYAWVADPSTYRERMESDLLGALMRPAPPGAKPKEEPGSAWTDIDVRAVRRAIKNLGKATRWVSSLRRFVE